MKDKILDLMNHSTYIPSDLESISIKLNIKPNLIIDLLAELQKENIIFESKKHKFGLLKHFNMFVGKIEIKEKGFGFIHSEEHTEDFYVPKTAVKDAMNNDTVIFTITNTVSFGKIEASVVKVISRTIKIVIGKIVSKKGKIRFVANDPRLDIIFEVIDFGISVIDDVVIFKATEIINASYIRGIISEVIGNINDVGIEVKSIAYKYGFVQEFPAEVISELKNLSFDITKEKRRVIKGNIITIDGDDAKDLDDAISIKLLSNGNYELGVYIADVSYFVTENSALDQEAYNRATSVYLVDRVIPMLPHKLSNDLCSLNPNEEKLVIACLMEITPEGDIINHDIFEGIIITKYRMTYNKVNDIYAKDKDLLKEYSDIVNDLLLMREAADILSIKRTKRGSLDFDIPEAEIITDEKGHPLDIILRKRGIGEKMIEEFMLVANETVATLITHLELPFIYRVHDKPNIVKLQKYIIMSKSLGYSLTLKKDNVAAVTLQKFLSELREEDKSLATLLLRTMAKAKYSEKNIGHYGLASPYYTHFTAPIRRYPDLLVHRLLRLYLFTNKVDKKTQEKVYKFITHAAYQASVKERAAIDCEYEVNDMKKAEYMQSRVGLEYNAVISGVTSFGLFASLANTVEGFIHISDLDGYFVFDDKKQILVAKEQSYRIGQKIRVRVKKVNIDLRQIDFEIIRGIDHGKHKNYRKK